MAAPLSLDHDTDLLRIDTTALDVFSANVEKLAYEISLPDGRRYSYLTNVCYEGMARTPDAKLRFTVISTSYEENKVFFFRKIHGVASRHYFQERGYFIYSLPYSNNFVFMQVRRSSHNFSVFHGIIHPSMHARAFRLVPSSLLVTPNAWAGQIGIDGIYVPHRQPNPIQPSAYLACHVEEYRGVVDVPGIRRPIVIVIPLQGIDLSARWTYVDSLLPGGVSIN
ncbi:hypothetical protein FISHEDRAFT_73985 [Fistulina hepatica ATCC 64428]|uniref:Uncharacterized protein n=1 Tax=Fistulina hepatica ATCC 64428 TaxID=1128425 RepID=A0A0D7ACC8_9AGAR|nr:hypothetical protein FISHEDRAFT_73985 [Fistulina hepatica ATCC 64428]